MQSFTRVTGPAAPLLAPNIDTDVIIRIERLTSGEIDKLGYYALEALRYRPDGSENPDFVFNQPKFRGAPILIAGPNFGCGSSREGAVTALMAMGVRCILADSYGDIFYNNCFQNGLLPLRLSEAEIADLAEQARTLDAPFTIDLAEQTLLTPSGASLAFTIDAMRRVALLEGLDDIGQTLKRNDDIRQWQAADRAARPWVWLEPSS
jgi:3-isopropylmalate/(R)-2-methylmalate dehydratase small subunit